MDTLRVIKDLKFKKKNDIKLSELLEVVPSLKARDYSMAADTIDVNTLRICLTVENFKSPSKLCDQFEQIKKGVCSNYLIRCFKEGKSFKAKPHKKSMFQIPDSLYEGTGLVIHAHGTAITPFMSVLQRIKSKQTERMGKVILMYGIRNESHDFLFKDELISIFKGFPEGSKIELCQSRNDDLKNCEKVVNSGSKKQYVQARCGDIKDELRTLYKNGGHFMICGNGHTMVKDVDDILIRDIFQVEDLKEVIKNKRYMKEVWL